MAILTDLPFEMLSIVAADSGLTNRDRKQARVACKQLAAVMTPIIFRCAYLSRITTDRDAFLSLAATPHLAAHVQEIIWFELEIHQRSFEKMNRCEVQLSDGSTINLFSAARCLFWLPLEPPLQYPGSCISHRSPPECATEFLVQFKAAVARMPKLRTFASEPMAPPRIVSLVDGFPFEVGRLMFPQHQTLHELEVCSDFLHIFLDTIVEGNGRITNLRCGNELSASLGRVDPRHHAALPYLSSLEMSISDGAAAFYSAHSLKMLPDAMFEATELRELSVSVDCNPEVLRCVRPSPFFNPGLVIQPAHDKVHRWKHLRSLKLGAIDVNYISLLPVIKAHITTLRHLHLDQCRPGTSFALELSQLEGLQLDSITISDSEIPKSGLVPEDELLRFIRGEDLEDKRLAKKIGKGKFVTHNRRTDNIDDKAFEDPESDLDSPSDHSSEWWSDTDSESEPDTAPAGQDRAEVSG